MTEILRAIDELYMKHSNDLTVPIETIRQALEDIVAHIDNLLEALPNEEDRST